MIRFDNAGPLFLLIALACSGALVTNRLAAQEPVDKPAESAAPAGTDADNQPADQKQKPAAEKPADARSKDGKPGESKPAEGKPADGKPADKATAKPADGKTPPDDKAAKDKPRSLIAPAGLLDRAPGLIPFAAPGRGKLDLNTATLEQIQRLPGVGVTWAPRILAGRPYRTFGDLARDGIPYTTIDALSRTVVLGP